MWSLFFGFWDVIVFLGLIGQIVLTHVHRDVILVLLVPRTGVLVAIEVHGEGPGPEANAEMPIPEGSTEWVYNADANAVRTSPTRVYENPPNSQHDQLFQWTS